MHHASPILTGNRGFNGQNYAPDFVSERQPALWHGQRRLPAVIRVANPENLTFLGEMSEESAFAAVRYWIQPDRIKQIHRKPPPDAPDYAKQLQSWVVYPGNRHLLGWWRGLRKHRAGTGPWRSPREFAGYRAKMVSMKLPHVEPFEVAHFRLPDDIACDPDVVLLQAWCQGWQKSHFKAGHLLTEGYAGAIRSGLEKFCRSPWIRFAVAAPHMQPIGVLFPGASYFDTSKRLEYLIDHPFMATDAELEHIFLSGVFQTAFRQARDARKKGDYLSPAGGWYVGGSMSRALGPNFKRGGLQPPRLST